MDTIHTFIQLDEAFARVTFRLALVSLRLGGPLFQLHPFGCTASLFLAVVFSVFRRSLDFSLFLCSFGAFLVPSAFGFPAWRWPLHAGVGVERVRFGFWLSGMGYAS